MMESDKSYDDKARYRYKTLKLLTDKYFTKDYIRQVSSKGNINLK